jgi:hypothetical protein
MAAPTVYTNTTAPAGTGLFAGLKFWIAQRVPIRSQLIKEVVSNGGQVVPLEKQADMLIADPVRKDVPPGSYSWQFIDFSVGRGRLEDRETHLIIPGGISRPAGAGASVPAKKSRMAFSAEDDDILTRWVLSKDRQGAYVSGNDIYKELEKKVSQSAFSSEPARLLADQEQNPRHTWQSWRDRWVKKLDREPGRQQKYLEVMRHENRTGGAQVKVESSPQPTAETLVNTQPPPPSRSLASSRQPVSSISNRHTGNSVLSRTRFTKEDDRALRRFCEEAARDQKSLSGNSIYIDFAENHPRHSWQSWRDRWVRHLSLRDEDESDEEEPEEVPRSAVPARTPASRTNGHGMSSANRAHTNGHSSPALARGNRVSNGRLAQANETRRLNGSASGIRQSIAVTPSRGAQQTAARQPSVSVKEEDEDSDDPTRVDLPAAIRGESVDAAAHHIKRDPDEDQGHAKQDAQSSPLRSARPRAPANAAGLPKTRTNDEQRDRLSDDLRASSEEESVEDELIRIRPQRSIRDQFFLDLDSFMDATGAKIDVRPRIGSRSIDIWDLYKAMASQKVPAAAVDWEEVATALGFDWVMNPQVTRQLKMTYESQLREFEASLRAFAEFDAVDDEDEEEAVEDEVPVMEAEEIQDSQEEVVLESRLSGLKRALQKAVGIKPAPVTPPKRKQADHDLDAAVSSGNRHGFAESKRRRTDMSSPAAARDHGHLLHSDTQMSMDVTPSQQLRSEMANVTPIPYRGEQATARHSASDPTAQGERAKRASSYVTADDDAEGEGEDEQIVRDSQSDDSGDPPGKLLSSEDVERFESMGYDRDVVLQAFKATNITAGNAGFVMEHIRQHREIPEGHAGIWTDRDDKELAFVDDVAAEQDRGEAAAGRIKRAEVALARLEEKHGEAGLALRREFLMSWEDVLARSAEVLE